MSAVQYVRVGCIRSPILLAAVAGSFLAACDSSDAADTADAGGVGPGDVCPVLPPATGTLSTGMGEVTFSNTNSWSMVFDGDLITIVAFDLRTGPECGLTLRADGTGTGPLTGTLLSFDGRGCPGIADPARQLFSWDAPAPIASQIVVDATYQYDLPHTGPDFQCWRGTVTATISDRVVTVDGSVSLDLSGTFRFEGDMVARAF
ncbi:MAG: hypothetical protein D6689_13410 [Deltaproteobacteria bacterium]|nr:MAG: hypothetical protein D6689_13410 [Deltaproteobacteria bacterium]